MALSRSTPAGFPVLSVAPFVVLAALLCALAVAAPPAMAHGIVIVERVVVEVPPHPPRPWPPEPPANPVVLKDHRVDGTIRDRVADVTVEQVFHNRSDRQLEGTYLFPLPEGALVARFAMTMGGRMVEGEALPADQARRIYEDIVRRRRDPGLLEYVGRGLFKARVFPIEPHQDLTIRLVFQQILPEDAGTLEFRYPLATERLHGEPVASAVVSLKVESPADLKALYSPSHDVAIVREGNRKAHVSYERSGRVQDRDFLLYVGRSPGDVGFSLLSHKTPGEDGTFLAVLAPSADVPADRLAPKDVVYVLDTSGSMAQDGKLDQAKKALEYGVRVLRPADRFAVVSFSGAVRPFRDALVEATAEMKDAAAKWIGELQPAGGTNIEEALREALRMRTDRLFLVVFLTDGKPTIGERDAERLVKMVEEQNAGKVRIFTFGVGFDLDVRLLDRIAETTRAARDYIMPKEDLEVATSRFFRKVSQPVLTDVTVEFGSGVHDVYPARLSDLFAGGQVVVMGRYSEGGDRVIRLKGTLGGQGVVHEYEATFGAKDDLPYLPRLWAHRKVAFLLDEIRLHGEDRELVDEVVRLATRYAIVTPYTAGLVVEESEMTEGRGRLEERAERLRARGDGLVGRLAPTSPAAAAPGFRGGAGGGPAGPGVREPAPGSVPSPAPAEGEAADSRDLAHLKDADSAEGAESKGGDDVAAARKRVQAVGDKTFLLGPDGRWVDTSWDGKAEPVKVVAYSEDWTSLLGKDPHVAKYMALGEKVLFVLEGKVYEVVPAP